MTKITAPAHDTDDIARMLRQTGSGEQADWIDLFESTAERGLALTQGVLYMQEHNLPVSADLARAALSTAKDEGGDDEIAAAEKALAAATA